MISKDLINVGRLLSVCLVVIFNTEIFAFWEHCNIYILSRGRAYIPNHILVATVSALFVCLFVYFLIELL